MQKHYDTFKENLSKIQVDFKRLLQSEVLKGKSTSDRKTVDAKKVAILIQKYMDESPNMLYQIITRNLGKTQITWDDLLKCLQDQFSLSYTVLKRQNKKFSISEAKWNNSAEFNKILNYFKTKQTNFIQSICKPNLGINISQQTSQCDIFTVLLQKQIVFYLIQEDRIICSFQFMYRNVRQKLLKKYDQRQIKKQIALRQNQKLDTMPLKQRRTSFIEINKRPSNISKSRYRRTESQSISQSITSKMEQRNRLDSNASSEVSSFLKRNSTDIGVSDWRKKSIDKKDTSVKVRTNTARKAFEYFETATLQNSIEIAKKFQESRNNFQKYMVLDKKLLEKQVKIGIQEIKLERKSLDFKAQLDKMRFTAKNFQRHKKSFFESRNSIDKSQENEFSSKIKRPELGNSFSGKNQRKNRKGIDKSINQISQLQDNHQSQQIKYQQTTQDKLLANHQIAIVSVSFYQNLFLVSLFNRQVRLYRVKKNLHRLKQQLIFQKQNQSVIVFVLLYRSVFAQTHNMVLCSNRNNQSVIKIYQISDQVLFSQSVMEKQHERKKGSGESKGEADFREIFMCKLAFNPIYQNLNPLGIGAFNQRGNFALIETNHISSDGSNKSEKKLFEKEFHNLTTGEIVSFTACKIHANLINIYLLCKNGYIYLIDKITAKIKLQKKVSQYRLLDMALIKSSTEILVVSERGELMIINSLNLEQMYYLETYVLINQESKLLAITESKFLFYSGRDLRVIDVEQNQQKLLGYQKPLKIYKNRIKIKKQQAILTKETGEIESKKQGLSSNIQFNDNPKPFEIGSIDELSTTKGAKKFMSKFQKRKIKQFFTMNNIETPHYILVLQNGQILVYDFKGQYFGSFLKDRALQVRQCQMNKKMYYLGILYNNNSFEVVNLYNQVAIFRYPQLPDEQQNPHSKSQINDDESDILCIGFINPSSSDTQNSSTKNQIQNFIYSIDKQFTISIFNLKGVKTKIIQGSSQNFIPSFTSFSISKRMSDCILIDKNGDLLVGTQKGEICFYQKNTYLYAKSLKLTFFPIVKTQLLSKFSNITSSKQRNKYILVLAGNNEIFLLNKENKIFSKIYSPIKQIQEGKFVQKVKDDTKKDQTVNKGPKTEKNIDQKISSTHYFSKIVAFSQDFVVYEWEQIYEKKVYLHDQHNQFGNFKESKNENSFDFTSKLKSYLSQTQKQKKLAVNYQIKVCKQVGYLIQKITTFKELPQHHQRLNQNTKPQQKRQKKDDKQVFKNQRYFFLTIWSTEYAKTSDILIGHKGSLIQKSQQHHLHQKHKTIKPYELYCFVQSSRLSLIIQPQSQFSQLHDKSFEINLHPFKTKRQNDSSMSRKSSLVQSQVNIMTEIEHDGRISNLWNSQLKQHKEKSKIIIYDFAEFLSVAKTQQRKDHEIKIILQQYI